MFKHVGLNTPSTTSLSVFAMNFSQIVSKLYVSRKKIATYGVSAFITGLVLGALLLNLPNLAPSNPGGQQPISLLSNTVGSGAFTATLPELTVQLNATQYTLPVNLSEVENYEDLQGWLQMTSAQEQLLSQNGFAVLRDNTYGTLSDFYTYEYEHGMPMLITSDAVLHAYHMLFDETLRYIETFKFADDINETINTLLVQVQAEAQSNAGTPLETAARLNLMYIEVAHALMQPSFTPTTPQAQQELQLISSHNAVTTSPIFGYDEDYTQYIPRGHYTTSTQLEQYFLTMMWLGRMRFQLLHPDLTVDLDQTRAASLLTWLVTQNISLYNVWQKIYATTSFFVGVSDDLTLQDYVTVLNNEGITNPQQLADENTVTNLAHQLLNINKSKILGDPIVADTLQEALNLTAGLRFMDQRFIPDSYIFQQLVTPQVIGRSFPKGLDVPAVLGSDLAKQILNQTETKYPNYIQQTEKLETEFAALSIANWTQNLYWTWLYTANTTLANISSEAKYPTFMTTPAWNYEKLQTFEGTWTELRHDTILYVKQSYTSGIVFPASNTAYVEPCPETYRMIIVLLNMTINGLTQLGIFSPQTNSTSQPYWATFTQRIVASFMNASELFLNASTTELEGKTLDANVQNQIRDAAERCFTLEGDLGSDTTQQASLAADVHTDLTTGRVLEEALANFSILIVVYADANGTLYSAAGPAFNYYEFTVPANNRLTDEAWRTMLSTNQTPQPPEWTDNFAR